MVANTIINDTVAVERYLFISASLRSSIISVEKEQRWVSDFTHLITLIDTFDIQLEATNNTFESLSNIQCKKWNKVN